MNATLKKSIFTVIWTVGASIISFFLFSFGVGMFFGMRITAGYDQATTERYAGWVGAHVYIVPVVAGIVVVLLCLFGRLPGTRHK
jgi:hypothetical protein